MFFWLRLRCMIGLHSWGLMQIWQSKIVDDDQNFIEWGCGYEGYECFNCHTRKLNKIQTWGDLWPPAPGITKQAHEWLNIANHRRKLEQAFKQEVKQKK